MEASKDKKRRTAATDKQKLLRAIPQVDEVLQWLSPESEAPIFLVKQAVREELEKVRQNILAGKKTGKSDLTKKKLLGQIYMRLKKKLSPNFKKVINATGVVIHTNLGRSVLPADAREAAA